MNEKICDSCKYCSKSNLLDEVDLNYLFGNDIPEAIFCAVRAIELREQHYAKRVNEYCKRFNIALHPTKALLPNGYEAEIEKESDQIASLGSILISPYFKIPDDCLYYLEHLVHEN